MSLTLFWFLKSTLNVTLFQLKNKFRKKVQKGTEAANVLVGEVDFIEQPFVAFVRLKEATVLSYLTEMAIPSRYYIYRYSRVGWNVS